MLGVVSAFVANMYCTFHTSHKRIPGFGATVSPVSPVTFWPDTQCMCVKHQLSDCLSGLARAQAMTQTQKLFHKCVVFFAGFAAKRPKFFLNSKHQDLTFSIRQKPDVAPNEHWFYTFDFRSGTWHLDLNSLRLSPSPRYHVWCHLISVWQWVAESKYSVFYPNLIVQWSSGADFLRRS